MNASVPDESPAARWKTLCDQFKVDWKAGRARRIEEIVRSVGVEERESLRAALIAIERELRDQAYADTAIIGSSVHATATPPEVGATAAFVPAKAAPKFIGRFEIRGTLGAGAFGRIYRGFDAHLGREVAIKVPHASTVKLEKDRARFLREARAAATINHSNVCQIYEVGEFGGLPYIVMALVPGQSLADAIKTRKELLPEKQIVVIIRKLALALAAAHDKGIIHRDLKPANIMFDKERKDIIVMDFGLARGPLMGEGQATQSGMIMGTPAYMSPEQARGDSKDVGPAGDIFSLGVIFYELLTGTRPFSGTATEIIGQILHVAPVLPSVHRAGLDPRLEDVCQRCMAKAPSARFSSMKDVVDALDAVTHSPLEGLATTDTSRAITTAADNGEATSENRKWDDMFGSLSLERKAPSVSLRTKPLLAGPLFWILGAAGIALLCGVVILGGVLLTRRTDKVTVTLGITDIAVTDPSLRFFLDEEAITGAALASPITIKPGDHLLVVKRGDELVKRMLVTITDDGPTGVQIQEIALSASVNSEASQPPAPLPPETATTPVKVNVDDFSLLQGKWYAVAEEFNGATLSEAELQEMNKTLEFLGDQFVLERTPKYGPRSKLKGQLKLYHLMAPKQCDWSGNWDDNNASMEMNGIYEVNDDTFRVAYTVQPVSGTGVRPTEFRTKGAGAGEFVVTFKRRPDSDGFVSLFNGNDLSGWVLAKGDAENWQVKGGELVGFSPRKEAWLLSTEDYDDFTLRFQYRLRQNADAHGGMGFRLSPNDSKWLPIKLKDNGVANYPNGEKEETGTIWIAGSSTANKALEPLKSTKNRPSQTNGETAWNDAELSVIGSKMTLDINGQRVQSVDLGELARKYGASPPLTRTRGRIGLQIRKSIMRFRNIEVQRHTSK